MRCWPPRGDARLSVHVWLRRQRKGRVPGYVRAALRDWRSRLCPPVSSGLHRCGTPNEALHCRSCVDVRPPLGARERRTAPAWHTNIRLATVLVGKSRPSRACRCAAGAPASAGVSSVSDGQGISTERSRTKSGAVVRGAVFSGVTKSSVGANEQSAVSVPFVPGARRGASSCCNPQGAFAPVRRQRHGIGDTQPPADRAAALSPEGPPRPIDADVTGQTRNAHDGARVSGQVAGEHWSGSSRRYEALAGPV
jgi:hypothetical protein